MFPTGFVIVALVPLVLVVIAYFISRTLFKVMLWASTAIFIISIIAGGILVYDAYRFTQTMAEEPTRFVLAEPKVGVEVNNGSVTLLGSIEESNGTVFIINRTFLSENATVRFEDANLTRSEALGIIDLEDPFTELARLLAQRTNTSEAEHDDRLRDAFNTSGEADAFLFGELLTTTIAAEGDESIILGIHDGTIEVEPSRPITTFINRMPASIIEQSLEVEV